MSTKKFLLEEKDIPTAWYNIVADMKNKPLPILNPQTKPPKNIFYFGVFRSITTTVIFLFGKIRLIFSLRLAGLLRNSTMS